jgi:MFS family permease
MLMTVASIISSLGAPLLSSVARSLHVSLNSAQWSLTVALLAGAIAAPVMGRLGDGPFRRQAILGALATVFVGSLIAGLSRSLPPLLLGRAMQGVGLGLAPLTMAAARDHLSSERAPAVIGVLSVSTAAGLGAGYPISGLIAQELNVHAAFLFGAVISGLALLAAFLVIPSSSESSRVPLDLRGAALVVVGLAALLLAVGQGSAWGWDSTVIICLFAAAVLVLGVWARSQLTRTAPLVELRELRHRAVLTADLAAIVLGVAMYLFLTLVTEFVEVPSSDYGFGASTLLAGLCLLPFSLTSLAASRTMPPLMRRFGTSAVLVGGTLTVAVAGAFFALEHRALWEAYATMGLVGVGFGYTYAAIPGLIIRSVPEHETGSAMGLYQVIRYVGFSVGSALTASILASHTAAGSAIPSEQGYVSGLWVGAGICALSALGSWLLGRGTRTPAANSMPQDALEQLIREDSELASAGLPGIKLD